ncbi:MAG: Ig-like domain-containing protein [Pirellulaceae bacterium]|nr:Ig-like domain-containing protein [Pirellulaceae bacterium]
MSSPHADRRRAASLARRRSQLRRPRFESLEDRRLLAQLFTAENAAFDSNLAELNPSTGGVTQTFATQTGVLISGMAYDSSSSTLFGFDAFNGLYRINTSTGAYTAIGSSSLEINGLAVQPGTFDLFGITSGGSLYRINKTTGATTFVGSSGAPASTVHGLAFSPGGTLYASDTVGSGTSNLLTVNPSNGARTMVATINRDFVVGLDFSAAGLLYGTDNGTDTLIVINPSSGAATTVGPFGNAKGHNSLAFTDTSGGGDTTPPTVTNRSPAPGATISTASADIDVTFSETVSGVDATDLVLTGSAGGSVGAPTNVGGSTWRFPLSGLGSGTLNVSLAPDANDIEDSAGNDLANLTWSYTVSLPSGNTEGFETGDFSAFPWTFGGNANWIVTPSASNTGSFSARSGAISDSQSSNLSITVNTIAGNIEFARRVSSEQSFDYLRFYIDGVQQTSWSGIESGFSNVSFPVTAGVHTFEWRYTKDGSVSSGLDAAFIDDIVFPPAPADTTPPSVTNRSPVPGATITTISADIDVTFSEAVNGVDASDLVLTGSAGGIVGAPTNVGGNTWRFPLSGLASGTLNISLAPDANDIEDPAGNDLANLTWSYTVSLPVNNTEGFETGDFSAFPWTFGGNANWIVTPSASNTGSFSARSGAISHFQSSSLSITINAIAGNIEFARRVSSEQSFDFLRFYIDGVQQASWSGIENGFTNVSFPVTAGVHTFEWRYTKDGSVNSGLDAAFIDDVVFPLAGGGGGGVGQVFVVAQDSVSDSGILRFSETGTFETNFGGTSNILRTMATNGTDLFVGNFSSNHVLRYAPDGSFLGTFVDTTGQLGSGADIAKVEFDGAGNLLVTPSGFQSNARTSRRYNSSGSTTASFSHPNLVFPNGIDADAAGNVWIVNSAAVGVGNQLFKFSPTGTFLGQFSIIGQVNSPNDLAIDEANGILYVGDEFGGTSGIKRYNISSGTPVFQGSVTTPSLSGVLGISYDPASGHLFATDSGGAIEITTSGSLVHSFTHSSLVTGRDVVKIGSATSPADTEITLDSGNLVVTDTNGASNDTLTIAISGGLVVISDPNQLLGTTISGATGSGTHSVTIPLSAFSGGIIVDAQGGDDSLTIDFSGGNFSVPIQYNGGPQDTPSGDQLVLQGGSFANAVFGFVNEHDGTIDLTGNGTITYTGLEPVTSSIDAANVTLNYSSTAETITVTDAGGGQTTVDSDLGGETVTFDNPTTSLTINAGNTGNDTVNIDSLAANYPASIVIDGQGGVDTLNINDTVSLAVNRSLTASADTINLPNAASDIMTSGTGTIALTADRNIAQAADSGITSQHGGIMLEANASGTAAGNFVGVSIDGSVTTTGSGTVTILGTGGSGAGGVANIGVELDGGTISSGGSGAVVVIGTGGASGGGSAGNSGVVVDGGAISSGGGAVTVTGTGGSDRDFNRGVEVFNSGTIGSGGSGAVSVTGIGGAGGGGFGGNGGVVLFGAGTISSGGSGTVMVTGTGGTDGGNNKGVENFGGEITSGGGTVTVTGTGGSDSGGVNTGDNNGVEVFGGQITSGGSGAVMVTGTGGTGVGGGNVGVLIAGAFGGSISSGGAGAVTVMGTGGTGDGGVNVGVEVRVVGTLTSGGGDVTVAGTGGSGGAGNSGVLVHGRLTSGGGAVMVTGTGGTGDGGNSGVVVASGFNPFTGTISSGGGDVTVNGSGGTGDLGFNSGVAVIDRGTISSGGSGAVSVTGMGGAGVDGSNIGVLVGFTGFDATITSGGTGTVTVVGTGGPTGGGNHGVLVSDGGSQITAAGNIDITGTASGSSGIGVLLNSNAMIGASGAANLEITGSTPAANGNGVFLNGPITSHSGTVLISAVSNEANVRVNANLTKTAGADSSLTIRADGDIIFGSGADVSSASGQFAVTFNSDRNAAGGGGIALNSGTNINSNGGHITLGGGASPLTTPARGTSDTSSDGVRMDSSQLIAGTGNISVRGEGPDEGVEAIFSAAFQTTTGNITIDGRSTATTGDFRYGAAISGTTQVSSVDGDIQITGQGGNTSGNLAVGAFLAQTSQVSTSGSGHISMIGTGGNTTNAPGVRVDSSVSATGSGNVTLNGTGGLGNNDGVAIGGSVSAASGALLIQGDGSGSGDGVQLDFNAAINSGSGPVDVISEDDVEFAFFSSISSISGAVTVIADNAVGNSGGALNMADLTMIDAGSGVLTMLADGNVLLSSVTTTSAANPAVLVTSTSGAIVDNLSSESANVTGGVVVLRAATGIGSAGDLETATSLLAAANTISGQIHLTNNVGGLLTIGTVDGLPGITNGGGGITVVNASPLTVAASVLAVGPVALTASDSAAVGDDLTVNGGGVFVQSTGSSVTLNAGDDALIDGNLLAATTVTINGDAGDLDPGTGATVTINGAVTTSGGALVNGNPDDDTFNLSMQTTTGFTIDGRAPSFGAGVPPAAGDTLNLGFGAAADPTLTVGGTPGAGMFTASSPEQPVEFTDIEQFDSSGPFHLVVDRSAVGLDGDEIDAQVNAPDLEIRVNGGLVLSTPWADVLSLTMIGSSHDETFSVTETASGLPSFLTTPPSFIPGSNGGHLNTSQTAHLSVALGAPPALADVTVHIDGGGGGDTDDLLITLLASHAVFYTSDTLDAANSGNIGIVSAPVTPPPLNLNLLMSFANLEPITMMGAGGELWVDASSTPATSSMTISDAALPGDGVSIVTGDGGFEDTTFSGFDSLFVFSGTGSETVTLASADPTPSNGTALSGIVVVGDNSSGTDPASDTINVWSLPATISASLNGGAGDDSFNLFDPGLTVDNFAGPVQVLGDAGHDSLTVLDPGDVSGDTVWISETTIAGMTSFAGLPDISYFGIEQLDVTTSSGGDLITIDLTTGGSDLVDAVISGAGGNDVINVRDDGNLGEPVVGLVTLTINGNAGSDTFNQPTGPPNPNPNTDPRGKLLPSLTTTIFVNGDAGPAGSGNPTSPPNGDTDTFNLDTTALVAPVIVDTIAGIATSAGPHQAVFFSGMEDLCLDDATRDDVNTNIGELYVRTTDDRERITYTSWNDGGVKLRIDNLDSGTSITFPEHFGLAGGVQMLQRIVTFAQDGDDLVSIAGHVVDAGLNPIPVEFHGEEGNDYLTGANGDDILVGGPGNDRVLGGEGDNQLFGDGNVLDVNGVPIELMTDGDDNISGRGGADALWGGGGHDQLYGSGGDDVLSGGGGNDLLDGGLGTDILRGGDGNDTLSGSYGDDLLLGGAGDDSLFGRQDNDILIAGTGADQLRGDAGNDLLVAGTTDQDNATDAALLALLAAWSGGGTNNLTGITGDGDRDDLQGASGIDEFWAEILPDPALDLVRDAAPGESVNNEA